MADIIIKYLDNDSQVTDVFKSSLEDFIRNNEPEHVAEFLNETRQGRPYITGGGAEPVYSVEWSPAPGKDLQLILQHIGKMKIMLSRGAQLLLFTDDELLMKAETLELISIHVEGTGGYEEVAIFKLDATNH